MVGLTLATILSCSDVVGIVNRLQQVVGLSYQQKVEVLQVLKQHVSSCPIQIKEDGKRK